MEKEDELMKALEKEMAKKIAELNSKPVKEIDNLSPIDLHQILYDTFGEESPIGFKKTISKSSLAEIPFLKLFEEYMNVINVNKELKLTARGNLPRKVCLDLYGKGIIKEYAIESGITKLSKEADSITLQNVKIIGEITGITKKRNNKISLTKKGIKFLNPDKKLELFKEIFITNYSQFNLGYHDGYPQNVGLQSAFGYTLYLLLRYGSQRRKLNFYTKKRLLAFSFELEHFEEGWSSREERYENCYGVRIFERFLAYYGLIDYHNVRNYKSKEKTELQVTRIFEEIFELRNDRFKFTKNQHTA